MTQLTAPRPPDGLQGPAGTVFLVPGIPAPQGSKKGIIVRGKVVMVESSAKVKPWRDAVEAAARTHCKTQLAGPVQVTLSFFMPRPQRPAHPHYPVVMPDLDKLVRSTLDGLAQGGAYANDSQVVTIMTTKAYGEPGCLIALRELGTAP